MSNAVLDIFIISHGADESELYRCAISAQNAAKRVGRGCRVTVRESNGKQCELKLPHDAIRLVTGENRGYGAACNAMAKGSEAKYLLFMNSDVELAPCAPSVCVDALEKDPRAAVCGIAMYSPDGRAQAVKMSYPTARQLTPTALARCRGYRLKCQSKSGQADWVLGACIVVRRSAFIQIGGFDERFFLYFEETDLCLRLKRMGYSTLYVAEVGALHLCGGRNGVSPFCVKHSVRSRVLYSALHFSKTEARRVYIGALLWEPFLRFAQAAARGENPFCAFAAPMLGAISGRRAAR